VVTVPNQAQPTGSDDPWDAPDPALALALQQLRWYATHRNRARVTYETIEVLLLLLTATTTVAAALKASAWVTAILAASTVVLAGLNKVLDSHDNWVAFGSKWQQSAIRDAVTAETDVARLPKLGAVPSPLRAETYPKLPISARRRAAWPAGSAHLARLAGQPPRVGQRAPQQELYLGVGAAQLVGGPSGQGVVHGRIQPQQDALALTHRAPSQNTTSTTSSPSSTSTTVTGTATRC
jgi:hypothetical protein